MSLIGKKSGVWLAMSLNIDPREVLEHLQYLGYRSITKEQLKEFVRDLKRLIKYEERKEGKESVVANGEKVSAATVHSPLSFPAEHVISPRTEPDSYSPFNLAHSDEESVQPSQEKSSSERSYHPNDYIDEELSCRGCDNCMIRKLDSSSMKKKVEEQKPSAGGSGTKWSEAGKAPEPIPSFIRSVKTTGRGGRCDPVALYHYYQHQWSKRPLPGEDPRTDLRWAVRTRLAQQQGGQWRGASVEQHRRRFNS